MINNNCLLRASNTMDINKIQLLTFQPLRYRIRVEEK